MKLEDFQKDEIVGIQEFRANLKKHLERVKSGKIEKLAICRHKEILVILSNPDKYENESLNQEGPERVGKDDR